MPDTAPPRAVGLLGAGVIGGGWAARFQLHGTDVRLYDPDPDAAANAAAMLDDARRAYRRLTMAPLPPEGTLTVVATPEEAAEGMAFVQESAPEDEPLKCDLLARASRAAGPEAVIASSTSGLLPSRLQTDMPHPNRLTVGHPFNPVYLLPLVELCGGSATDPDTLERAARTYDSVGMAPLVIRKEIDGFIADRLLEALWREALWLVHDDVATVAEIDDALRLGPGLRWSCMGTFMNYRVGGGEMGMRHFLAQFGPALKWPWTKLMDVPELTDDLLERIVAQSDAQADGRSYRELARLRDDCLVDVMHALRAQDTGAGAVLAEHERRLFAAGPGNDGRPPDQNRPLRLLEAEVAPEWVDYNGHMHESRYLQVFGDASDALFRHLGIDADYLANGGSYYTVESHLRHLREAAAGQRLYVTTQILGYDRKRLHVFHSLYSDGGDGPLATAEQMQLHVDTEAGGASPVGDELYRRVAALAGAQEALPLPDGAGRRIEIPV